jgi:hypothetical protein
MQERYFRAVPVALPNFHKDTRLGVPLVDPYLYAGLCWVAILGAVGHER